MDAKARVGEHAPNPFGLHDVLGNALEWCRDPWGKYSDPVQPGTGERRAPDEGLHPLRGGGFLLPLEFVRVSLRLRDAPEFRTGVTGVRAARDLR